MRSKRMMARAILVVAWLVRSEWWAIAIKWAKAEVAVDPNAWLEQIAADGTILENTEG